MTLDQLYEQFVAARKIMLIWLNSNNFEEQVIGQFCLYEPDAYVRDIDYSREKRPAISPPTMKVFHAMVDDIYFVAKLYCIAKNEGIAAATLFKLAHSAEDFAQKV
jgi:hypothetical protein